MLPADPHADTSDAILTSLAVAMRRTSATTPALVAEAAAATSFDALDASTNRITIATETATAGTASSTRLTIFADVARGTRLTDLGPPPPPTPPPGFTAGGERTFPLRRATQLRAWRKGERAAHGGEEMPRAMMLDFCLLKLDSIGKPGAKEGRKTELRARSSPYDMAMRLLEVMGMRAGWMSAAAADVDMVTVGLVDVMTTRAAATFPPASPSSSPPPPTWRAGVRRRGHAYRT